MNLSNPVLIKKIDMVLNIIGLTGVLAVLALAFTFQIINNELPCPLCLYQRLGFFGVALGYLLNLRFGFKPSHYAIVLLSAFYIICVSLRQIALHIIPGTGAYGDPVLGMHLYTWSFVFAMLILASTTFIMGIDRQYTVSDQTVYFKKWVNALFALTTVLLILNVGSVFLECGFKTCPENPVNYSGWHNR